MADMTMTVKVADLPEARAALAEAADVVKTYRAALSVIAEETGTPYGRIAQAALDAHPGPTHLEKEF